MMKKKWFLFGTPFALGAFIAMLAPLNILDTSVADFIYRTASTVFPAVRKMKGDYELGQVAKLYYASTWIMCPLIFIGSYLDISRQRQAIITKCRERKIIFALFFFVFSPMCAFIMWNYTFESTDVEDVRVFVSFHSRWGLSFFGLMVPAGASTLAAMTAFGFKIFRSVFY